MENETNMQTSPAAAPQTPRAEGGMGATIGIIVIILVLAIGGVYLWMTKQASAPTVEQNQTASTEEADATTQALMQTSASDSASAIEADLSATNVGNAQGDLQVQ